MITVLTGTNSYAIAQSVRALTDSFDGEVERVEGTELEPRMLPDLCSGMTLFASQRMVVIRSLSDAKAVWSELEQWVGRVSDDIHIVLVEPAPDKRTKTYKTLQKHATIRDHREPSEAELVTWVRAAAQRAGMDLSPETARHLVGHVGRDQWRLANEIDKLALSTQPITADLIREITEPHLETSVFSLLDAVFADDTVQARTLFERIRRNEDPHQFLGLLSSQLFTALALINAGSRQPDEIARDHKLHPFVVKKLASAVRRLGREKIIGFVDRLARADERMKTVATDPWQQLEIALFGE